MTPKRFLHRRIASCSRPTATRIRTLDVGPQQPAGIGGVKEDKLSMLQSYAFRRLLVALALCSAAIAASATPASARSHHGAGRHAHARHAGHHARRHYGHRHYRQRASRWERGVAQMQARGFANSNASFESSAARGGTAISGGFGSSNVVAEARRYIGGNPTGRGSLWCARFMNMVLQHSGYRGTG